MGAQGRRKEPVSQLFDSVIAVDACECARLRLRLAWHQIAKMMSKEKAKKKQKQDQGQGQVLEEKWKEEKASRRAAVCLDGQRMLTWNEEKDPFERADAVVFAMWIVVLADAVAVPQRKQEPILPQIRPKTRPKKSRQ